MKSQDFSKLFSLKGKTAVLTGAAGFFGEYFTKALLDHDIETVFAIDINRVGVYDPRIVPIVLDQNDLEAVHDTFVNVFTKSVDILINCSFEFGEKTGFQTKDGKIENATFNQMHRSFVSGVYCPFQAMQFFANKAKREGAKLSVINIGSMYSFVVPTPELYEGMEYQNPPGYSMAKSALLGVTRYGASFYAPNVRVNAICPGAIPNTEKESTNSSQNKNVDFMKRLTDKTVLKRMGHPSDLVGALIYLASDASSYMTGQSIVIDGGIVIT